MENPYQFKEHTLIQIQEDIRGILYYIMDERTALEKEEYGPIGFKALSIHFDEVEKVGLKVKDIDLFKVPQEELLNFQGWTNELHQTLQSIHQPFTSNTNLLSTNARDNKIGKFILNKDKFIYYSNLFIQAYSNSESEEISQAKELLSRLSNAESEFNTSKSDFKNLVNSLSDYSKEYVVSKYGASFEKEATMYRNEGRLWLSAIIVITLCIVGFASYVYIDLKVNGSTHTTSAAIQLTIMRVVIISVLFYGLSFIIKNYKAAKHNQITNRHRHQALEVFDVLIQSTNNDPVTKNAVLLEVTRTIFSSQQTGFITNDNDDSPNRIIEIFKSSTSSSN